MPVSRKKNVKSPANDVLADLLNKFPDAPALTLAKKAYRDNPELWSSLEACRSAIRNRLGVHGEENRGLPLAAWKREPRQPGDWSKYIPEALSHFDSWGPVEVGGAYRSLVLSDIHIPYHDRQALETAIQYGLDNKANLILLNGDVHDCVTPETRILTTSGQWIPAGNLTIGMELVGFDEEPIGKDVLGRSAARKLRKSIVEQIAISSEEVIALHMEDGTVLRSTAGHRWLEYSNDKVGHPSKWMRTDEIVYRFGHGRNSFICKPCEPWVPEIDYDAGYISAALDGEGTLTFNKKSDRQNQACKDNGNFGNIHFSQKPNVFRDAVLAALSRKNVETNVSLNCKSGVSTTRIKGGMWGLFSFIGRFQMPRFVSKWLEKAPIDGHRMLTTKRSRVVGVVYEGVKDIVRIQTSSKTYFAEGFCSHNCYSISRFDKDPRQRDFPSEIRSGKSFLKSLRTAFPRARIIWKEGNHEERFEKYLRLKAPELLGIPDFTWQSVLGLDDLKIEWVGEKRPIRLGKLNVIHGHEFKFGISSPVNPARGFFLRAKTHTLGGHLHQSSSHSEKNLEQHVVSTWSTGCLCNLHSDYAPLNNHNHGFAFVVTDKDGTFNVDNLRILKGKVYR